LYFNEEHLAAIGADVVRGEPVKDAVWGRLPPVLPKSPVGQSKSSLALLGRWGVGPSVSTPLEDQERLFGWLYAIVAGLVLHVPAPGCDARYSGFLERNEKSTLDWPSIRLIPLVGRGQIYQGQMTIEGVEEVLGACPSHRNARMYKGVGVAGFMYRDVDRDTYEYGVFDAERWRQMTRWLDRWLPRE
jgi:hypothetical protein